MTSSIVQSENFRNPLETIFSFLDPITLILSKKVCQFWNKLAESEVLWKAIAKQRGLESKESVIHSLKMEKSLGKAELVPIQTLEIKAAVTSLFAIGNQLFAGFLDGMVRVWVETKRVWEEKQVFKAHEGEVVSLKYSQGKLITSSKEKVKIWELKGEEWQEVEHRDQKLTGGSHNLILGIYEVYAGDNNMKVKNRLSQDVKMISVDKKRYAGSIYAMSYSEGKLFTGSINRNIKIWGPAI